MSQELCVVGPPGTGKTRAGMTLCHDWIGRGTGSEEIAYLAFTKAAAQTAAARIMEGAVGDEEMEDRFPLFRTIHSLCYRGFRQGNAGKKRVMTPPDWKRFSKQTGLECSSEGENSEDVEYIYHVTRRRGKTLWDQARAEYALSRLMSSTEAELDEARERVSIPAAEKIRMCVDPKVYRCFVEHYERFKEEEGILDFTDMLEYGLREMDPVGARYLVTDEAQDLCQLHHAVLDRIFGGAEMVVWIADDGQAIYSFSGADADLFLARARRSPKIILRETHRFGQPIVDYSAQIIRRVVNRIDKDVIGVPGRGGKVEVYSSWKPTAGDYFILHRHVAGCWEVAQRFMEDGIPFRNERGVNPLGAANKVKAFEAVSALADGRKVNPTQIQLAVGELLPSTRVSGEGVRTRLVVHGAKKKLEGLVGERSLEDLRGEAFLTDDGFRVVRERRYRAMNHTEHLEYYARLVKNGYEVKPSGPIITTIHGSKGRQAPFVVLYSEMSRSCWADPDGENRVAYVGVTRTEGDVFLIDGHITETATERYPYPRFEA